MSYIKIMLMELKNGKRIRLCDYYVNPMKFYDDLEFYRLTNLNNKELQNELNILARTVRETNDKNVFRLDQVIEANEEETYKLVIQKILKLYKKDKVKAYEEAALFKLDSNDFNKIIIQFRKDFINADLFVEDLMDISKNVKILNESEKGIKHRELTYKERLIESVYESNLSLIDYSFYNYIGNEFDKYVYRDLNRVSPKYKEIAKRKDTTTDKILEIIDKINKEEINILEYYETTKLHPFLLTTVASKHNKLTHNFRLFIKKFNSPRVSPEGEKKGTLIISSVKVDDDMIDEAFRYLKKINAPATNATYKAMVRRLVQEKKDID